MITRLSTLLLLITLALGNARADEGMWLPLLLGKYNIADMQAKGFKLSAEDVYSVNQACLKDAIVMFGQGCTGEIVSDKGLVLTNHHCGFDYIQNHSSLLHDYLTDGFWAKNESEELTNPDLTVTILKRMEDVTPVISAKLNNQMSEQERKKVIAQCTDSLVKAATKDTRYTAEVKPLFNGNQYFLYVNEVFKDVRLVGTPPSAIGKFGGDTDNWMWPRHTGDFSVFRIYADKNNQPAAYSPENVPYHPASHLKISIHGVKEGDFTMVFGYPAVTQEYIPSYHVAMLKDALYPQMVALRDKKLEIIKKYMNSDAAIRIQYAAKDAGIANAWKKWKGEIKGLDRLDAVAKKQKYEQRFQAWADDSGNSAYQSLLKEYAALHPKFTPLKVTESYLLELFYRNGIGVVEAANLFEGINKLWKASPTDTKAIDKEKASLKQQLRNLYKELNLQVDEEYASALLTLYKSNAPKGFEPGIFAKVDGKYKGNMGKYVADMMRHTCFADTTRLFELLEMAPPKAAKALGKDAAWQLYQSIYSVYRQKVYPQVNELNASLARLNRLYMAAQMEFEPARVFYPDANSTLRIAYGTVKGYDAADAVTYNHCTTLEGIMQKDNPDIYDYHVPQRLKELYATKDYGRYGTNGVMPVCFIANNHTTGGNSGSPVLDANGRLIGINFDRAWDGITSDIVFNPLQSRNISLDIRYLLFIIDKYAGAGYLLDEMTIE
jgi:hypothetical protein